MAYHTEELKSLVEDVQVGKYPSVDLWPDDWTSYRWELLCDAFEGCLDSAKELHEDVLPGWVTWDASHTYFGYEVSLTNDLLDAKSCVKENPARAWLVAILEAIIKEIDT